MIDSIDRAHEKFVWKNEGCRSYKFSAVCMYVYPKELEEYKVNAEG